MAKNSAKSKGYRKQQQKKPFLTKGELIGAIIILIVFVFALIIFLNDDILFYIFPDGNLAARDVKEGDIVSYANNDLKTRFVKIGEIGELEGYTRETSPNAQNVPISYTFKPEDESSNVQYVTVSGSAIEASTLPESYRSTVAGLGATVDITDTVESTIQDHKAYYFSYTSDYYNSSNDPNYTEGDEIAEDAASNTFQQSFSAYIDVDGSHTLCLHINCVNKDAESYLTADQFEDYILSFSNCFTIIDPQKK